VEYADNGNLWRDIISGRLHAYRPVTLKAVELFQWIPRAPGRYFTEAGVRSRKEAMGHLERSGPEASQQYVFAPQGKISMLEGGVGCIRLKPVQIDQRPLWLMSASAGGVAHEGFPVALPVELYSQVHDRIWHDGSLFCDITGKLEFLPRPFTGLFQGGGQIQPLYLRADIIEPMDRPPSPARRTISLAVSFVSDFEGPIQVYASYVIFSPDVAGSFGRAVQWLKTNYVEGRYKGRIITDFDQTRTIFPEAELSLQKVMGRHLNRGELLENLELMQARGDVEALFGELDKRELLRQRTGQIREKVFLSYSHNERDREWMRRLRTHLKSVLLDRADKVWDDERIPAGERWHDEITKALATTKVAVLLVSADYLASDYVRQHELPSLLWAADSEGASIRAVMGSPCAFSGGATSLRDFQFVNPLDRPLDRMSLSDQETLFRKLALEIDRLLRAEQV
jgi:hypothetical protein